MELSQDKTPGETPVELEEDRGIPSVASGNKSNKKMALAFIAVGIVIFGVSYVNKLNATKSAVAEDTENKYYGRGLSELPSQPKPDDEDFIGSGYALNPPEEPQQVTIAELDKPAPKRQQATTQYNPTPQRNQASDERWARREGAGSTVAYDGGRSGASGSKKTAPASSSEFDINSEMAQLNAMAQSMPAMGMPDMGQLGEQQLAANGGVNPNTKFANEARGQIVEKAMAMPMGDLEHQIVQGKVIPCTLETAVDSSLPGQVRCIVNRDIYGESGRTVLIERGTRAVGQYNSAIQNGQYRIFMVWTRLINQKYDIAIGSPSTDNLGRAGSAGDVEGHFWKRFGNATLLSLLGAGTATYGTDGEQTASNAYRQAITNQFAAQANGSLQTGSEIPDTVHLDQGETIKIMVARDLDFGFMAKSGGL